MKPLYTTTVVKDNGKPDLQKIQGSIEIAFPELIELEETVRWRPQECHKLEAHFGHVFQDPKGNKVVVNSSTWEVFLLDSITKVNDQNRTDAEQSEYDKARG
jgi:hypothetical protein